MLAPILALALTAGHAPWHDVYTVANGFVLQPSNASWIGADTHSEATADGLHIVDDSAAAGSGRMYELPWRLEPGGAAEVEVTVRVVAAGAPWGCCVNVADGAVEEDVSFFADRVRLSYAGIEAPFPCSDGFHTYRIRLKGPDIAVWADGRPLLDGTGKFVHPVIAQQRNRLAFGASASTATSEATWQRVRYQGGKVEQTG